MSTGRYEPIAIIGIGLRLPGKVSNTQDYWNLLVNGRSGHGRVPKDRYNVDSWHKPGRTGFVGSEYGYYLDHVDLSKIDSSFWSFSKQEARLMDPQQRLLLEVVYETLESSGTAGWRGQDIGVYVGVMGDDWRELQELDGQKPYPMRADVFGDYILANRVSYELDLKGPSMVIRTACSSSLVALHAACQDVQSGNCASAVVGGVNLMLSPRVAAAMAAQGVLSPAGACRSFDAGADGYGRGEGVTAVHVKRLADALRDGDPVRAVIRATATGNDGRTPGLTAPDPAGHERLIRRAYAMAGIADPAETAVVECHGTGTSVGDPLECRAVANVWGREGILIGSVKPNVGHGEGSSGLTSIIKMVLSLENAVVPPNINFHTPNPAIPWEEAKLAVPTQALPWPSGRMKRVSVNSFGIGGTNAHAILESAESVLGVKTNGVAADSLRAAPRLLVLSAKHPKSAEDACRRLDDYLDRSSNAIGDIAYTLSARRPSHGRRTFCVTDGTKRSLWSPVSLVTPSHSPPTLVWVFTGQGAQWPQMGKQLIETHPVASQTIDSLDRVLQQLPQPPPWTIRGLLATPPPESRLHEAEFSQPCLAALQMALVNLFRSWGVRPRAVVGHSSGETAAAYAAGALTAAQAILLAFHRGQITPALKRAHAGGMAAVGLGRREVAPYLRPGVVVGCENSPQNVTLAGDVDALELVVREIGRRRPEVLARALRVECGYHSDHMKAVSGDYASRIGHLTDMKEPETPFYSSVTGKRHSAFSPSYWVANIESPVLFGPAVEALLDDYPKPALMEIGPHSALAGPVRQILLSRGASAPYIPTLIRHEDGLSCVLKTAGELWSAGLGIDVGAVNPVAHVLTDLPSYSWHYDETYWLEPRISRELRFRGFPHHELLGSRVWESGEAAPVWRCSLSVGDSTWLREHEIRGHTVMPAAGFIATVGEALRQLTGTVDYSLKNMSLLAPLVLGETAVEMVTCLRPTAEPSEYEFSVSSISSDGDATTEHVTGRGRAGGDVDAAPAAFECLPRQVSSAAFYEALARHGLAYGPRFRALTDVRAHPTQGHATAVVDARRPAGQDEDVYPIHPAVIDSSMHACMVAECQGLVRKVQGGSIPKHIQEVYVRSAQGLVQVAGRIADAAASPRKAGVVGVCEGRVVLRIHGIEIAPLPTMGRALNPAEEDPHAGAILEWRPDIELIHDWSKLSRDDDDDFCPRFLGLLGFKKPDLRVLHIGGHLPSDAPNVARVLLSGRDRICQRYVYTLSPHHDIPSARRQLEGFPDAACVPFDLAKDPAIQELEPGSFDLLIATATEAVEETRNNLRNASQLLRPGGYLFMKSALFRRNPEVGAQDGIVDAIASAGFPRGSIQCLPGPTTGSILATTRQAASPPTKVDVLCQDPTHSTVVDATGFLRKRGFVVGFVAPGRDLPAARPILCLLDLERPFLASMGEQEYLALRKTVLSVREASVIWVTGACQIDCRDPDYALGLGFGRTMRRELGLDFVTVELGEFGPEGWHAVADVLSTCGSRAANRDAARVDYEYVLDQGCLKISRFRRIQLSQELADARSRKGPEMPDVGTEKIPTTTSDGAYDVGRTPDAPPPGRHDDPAGKTPHQAPPSPGATPARGRDPGPMLRPDRTYLIVGGLGGLGQAAGRFLVEQGARDLLFFSRGAEAAAAGAQVGYVAELGALGCAVAARSGDVTVAGDVAAAVAAARRPIGGVLQAAMALADAGLAGLDFAAWRRAVGPKARGTWHLHRALAAAAAPLGFFVLFGSLAGLGGQPGQANYAAANAFLDAFAAFRRRRGEPAAVLDIGAVGGVGVLARDPARLAVFRAMAAHVLDEAALLDALELVLRRPGPPSPAAASAARRPPASAGLVVDGQIAIGLGAGPENRTGWARDPRLLLLFAARTEAPAAPNTAVAPAAATLQVHLRGCAAEPARFRTEATVRLIAEDIGRTLRGLMMGGGDGGDAAVDLMVPVASLGVDSLVSVELRNALRRGLGVQLSVMDIRNAASVLDLGRRAAEKLWEVHQGTEVTARGVGL